MSMEGEANAEAGPFDARFGLSEEQGNFFVNQNVCELSNY
jgi:hypothetical protein